jgi:hypothetical protein
MCLTVADLCAAILCSRRKARGLLVLPVARARSGDGVVGGTECALYGEFTEEITMVNVSAIKPHTPVVCSEGGQFAVVDHLEGRESIKLAKDKTGQHHFIPTSWVTKVDDKVHVDRPGEQAMREWTTAPKP